MNNIPKIDIGNSSELRVISGSFNNTKGPASTFTSLIFMTSTQNKRMISTYHLKKTPVH